MILNHKSIKNLAIFRLGVILLLTAFFVTSSGLSDALQAQTIFNLPEPGTMVSTSITFNPLELKGVQINPQDPLQFNFLIDRGQSRFVGFGLKEEVRRLTKYFLTCLTVPESDLWVNLSPYEKNRIAPEAFGMTQMGKDLLVQDYLLKQIVASITYPEQELGKHFWQQVYEKTYSLYGRTDIPINTFNKVWIVPKSAEVYAHGNSAIVVHSELDVMLETDYLALRKNLNNTALGLNRVKNQDNVQYSKLYSQIMREVVLPALRKEVNEGKNFALVRQVYNAMILATWYKRHLKDSVLGRMYVGKNKVNGVDINDKNVKEEIFRQYLIAYKKRVYDYIKEDYDPVLQKNIPRQYISGGVDFAMMGVIGDKVYHEGLVAPNAETFLGNNYAMASVKVAAMSADGQPFKFPSLGSFIPVINYKQIKSFARKLAVGLMFSIAAAFPLASQAAIITPHQDGTVLVQITKGDQLGKIAPDVYSALRKANPGNHEFAKDRNLYGPEGMVELLFRGKTKDLNKIYAGRDVFNIGTPKVAAETQGKVRVTLAVAEAVRGSAAADVVTAAAPPAAVEAVVTPGLPRDLSVRTAANSVDIFNRYVQQAKRGSGEVISSTGISPAGMISPAADTGDFWSEIKKNLTSNILFGIAGITAFGSAAFGFSKRKPLSNLIPFKRIIKNRRNKNEAEPSFVEEPENRLSAGDPKQFIIRTDKGPMLPDSAEKEWIAQQRAGNSSEQAEKRVTQAHKPNVTYSSRSKRALRVTDILGSLLGAGIAYYIGSNIGLAFIASWFATPIIYTLLLWKHEMGHIIKALWQSPKNYKEILTSRNIFGNYGVNDWLRTANPFLKPSHKAGVDLPLTGKERRKNQQFGFYFSSIGIMSAFSLAVYFHLWPFMFGPLIAASISLMINSFITDIWKPSASGKIECGDSGYIWDKNKFKRYMENTTEEFLPKAFQEALTNGRVVAGLRGNQGGGRVTWVQTDDGDVLSVLTRSLQPKRGKPVTELIELGFNDKLTDAQRQNLRPISGAVQVVVEHNRFLTQGKPSENALHPHPGKPQKRRFARFNEGEYQDDFRTLVDVVIENGDNDYQRKYATLLSTKKIRQFYAKKFHLEKTVYIEPDKDNPKGSYDYMASGDAPPLAYQVQWRHNQGDFIGSSTLAVDEIFYTSPEESMEHNMSEHEQDVLGDFYWNNFENGYEQILTRPGLINKNKTLKDCWVTKEMSEKHPDLSFQYEKLQQFREDLKSQLLTEVQLGSEVGNILNRLHQLHPEETLDQKIERYVDMTVERFFTADIFQATKEIDELTEGTGQYGVTVISSKCPGREILWSRGQSLSLAANREEGYIGFNSEHTALMVDMADAPGPKEILFLKSSGAGQITDVDYDYNARELFLKAYSPDKKRFLTEKELGEWKMELTPDNPYYTPLIKRDPDNVANEDIADIPRAVRDAQAKWHDPKSFVRQSARDFFNKLASRNVERYIKENSRFYRVAQGNLLYAVNQLTQLCDKGVCSEKEAQKRKARLLRAVEHDPRILSYLKSTLDQVIAHKADALSQQIVTGQYNEDILYPQLEAIDHTIKIVMENEIKKLSESIIANNLGFLTRFERAEDQYNRMQNELEESLVEPNMEGPGLPNLPSIGAGEADIFAAGMEDSLWIGSDNFRNMLLSFFPEMIIKTESSNKALDMKPNDQYKVGRRTLSFVVSKSGATSPSKNLVPVLNKITPDNVFAWTGRVDTLIGLDLGQRYYKGAPFIRRIFPTGNYYPTEVNSTSEVELMVNQIEFVLYIVKRMKETFPHQRPWGMDVSEKNIKLLESWKAEILSKSKKITGFDENGNKVEEKENKNIIQNARIYGKMLNETPWVKFFNLAFVFGVVYFGTPLSYLFGLPHFIGAVADFTLIATMPWWMSRVYRSFSGRLQRWARMGAPKVTLGENIILKDVVTNSASKRGAMAPASMDADYHGGNPQDHYGARFLHRVRRGSVLIFGLPEDPHDLGNVLMTASQSNINNNTTLGIKIWDWFGKKFKAGPEIFTIGHGDIDPNLTQHHMNIGPLETVTIDKDGNRKRKPEVTDTLSHYYESSFYVLDRLIAYNVFFNEAYDYATEIAKKRATKSIVKLFGLKKIFKPWKSQSGTGVFSTPSPKSGPKKPLAFYQDDGSTYTNIPNDSHENSDQKELVDAAQGVSLRKGGIDMNSHLMNLKVNENPNSRFAINDQAMISLRLDRVTPGVVNIEPITPEMLKSMLGEGFLN